MQTMTEVMRSLLHRLNEAQEASLGDKGVSVRVPEPARAVDALEFEGHIVDVEAAGIVRAVRARASGFSATCGRTTTLFLLNAPKLREHLGLSEPTEEFSNAVAEMSVMQLPSTLLQERDGALITWKAGGKWRGTTLRNRLDYMLTLRLSSAFLAQQVKNETIPMRSFSARELGNSKALRLLLDNVYGFLSALGLAPEGMNGADYARLIGIEPMPSPVLVAGPLSCKGVRIPDLDWMGIPPSAAGLIKCIPGETTSLLTIENLSTFARYAENKRLPGQAVVYTGGWPSSSVMKAIRSIVTGIPESQCVHWGDVDASGLAIGLYLHRNSGVPFYPHSLMDPKLAVSMGQTVNPIKLHRAENTPWEGIGDFLASVDARTLEQEVVDGM